MSLTQKNYAYLKKKEGDGLGVSDWILVDQTMIDQFAKVTQDSQFIHIDPERTKKETGFGGTIAHGFLVLSLASKFASDVFPRRSKKSVLINYGFDKVRFVSPVVCNSYIRGRFSLKAVDLKGLRELRQIYDLSIEIKGADRTAVAAEWITLTIFEN
jgi:acyl dehydratase